MPSVLYVVPSLGFGGAERQVVTLSRAMQREGWQVSVAILTDRDPHRQWLDRVGIEIFKFPRRGRIGLGGMVGLIRHILRTRPDIVHTFLLDADMLGRFAKLLRPRTVVISSERFVKARYKWHYRWLDRLTSRVPDHLIANSHLGAEFARDGRGFKADKVSVVHNGIDEEVFQHDLDRRAIREELGLQDTDIAVLRLASIRYNKNYELLLEVGEELRDDTRFKFLCAGDVIFHAHADEARYAMALRERLVAADPELGIRLLGHCSDVQRLLVAADISICTSRKEGFPNSILEALYYGLPVVTTPVSGVEELIVDGHTGWIIPDDEPGEFATRLKQLADDAELHTRMSAEAHERTARLFGSQALARNNIAVYEKLLRR